MNDESRSNLPSMAPAIVASPAKRIEALTGDPNFMTSLARGDRKSTRLNSSHMSESRMPSSA